jgi:photosystem II reaction center protein PsbP
MLHVICNNNEVLGQSLDETYANSRCGVSIQYPSSWISGEDNDDDATVNNFIVEIQPNSPDGYKTAASIELNDISGRSDRTFTGVKNFEEGTLIAQGDLKKIIMTEPAQIAGYPAEKIVYADGSKAISDNEGFKKMKVILVAFDREYVITFHATSPDYYDNNISTFEDMLNTFQITKPKFDGISC